MSLNKMSIEEFIYGGVNLNQIVEYLLNKVKNQLEHDEEKYNAINEAIENAKTPQESIELLSAILVYGYNYMSKVVESFADNSVYVIKEELISNYNN